MAYIDCDKCSHGKVCAYRHQYDDQVVTCNHWKPADDVVEVVRCKDCKWWHTNGCAFRKDAVKDLPAADDFCSYGERKEK